MSNVIPLKHDSDSQFFSFLDALRGVLQTDLALILQSQDIELQHQIDKTSRGLSRSLENANRVLTLIRHFREANPIGLTAESSKIIGGGISIHEVARDVLHAMQYEWPFERITVLKILPHDLKPLPIEREHLEAIVFQLIAHARRSLRDMTGIITIEASERIEPAFGKVRGKIRHFIRVSDTGPTIPENQIALHLNPFLAWPEFEEGIDMGIYLMKKAVEMNGGNVRMESSILGNSVFVEFPG